MEKYLGQFNDWLAILGPNLYLQAAAIVLVFFVLAKITDKVLTGVVARLVRASATDVDDRLIQLLHRPIFVSVMIIGLAMATLRLEMPAVPTGLTLSVLGSVAIIIWMQFGLGLPTVVVDALYRREKQSGFLQERTLPLLDNLAKIIVVALGLYFIMIVWNINVTAWLASAGIIGIAVGFAARDTLANVITGMTIIADAPYKLGDFINLDTGERGVVTNIGLRSTRILTRDDVEVTIPNAIMGNTKIINESGGPHVKYRVRVSVGVAYGSDIDHVMKVLLDVAKGIPEICREPEPRVRFRNFGGSSLDFELLGWIEEPVLRGKMLHVMNCEVYKAFTREGIEIPYSKHDLYIKETPASGA